MALPGQTPPIIRQNLATDQVRMQPSITRQQMPQTGGGLPPNQAMQTMGQPEPAMQAQPQYGLGGAEQALQAGLGGGISALEQAQAGALGTLGMGQNIAQQNIQQGLGGAQQQLQQGQQALGGDFSAQAVNVNPMTGQPMFQQAAAGVGAFSPAGLQAQGLQSALSGAQGQEAFNQAMLNSPVQQFLREQGEQSVINQAAATGGLGGGQVQKELAQFGQGLAGTQLQQQIQNLQALSGQGLQAAGQQGQFLSQAGQQMGNLAAQNAQLGTNVNMQNAANRLGAAGQRANLFGQGAGFQQQAGLQGAGIAANLAGQGAGIQQALGGQAANLFSGTGTNLAQGRLQTGRDLANQISGTTSQLSNLANQQGSGLSDILGQGGANIANLLSGAGQLTAGQQTQLAQLLSNLAIGEGSQIAGAQSGIGQAQAGGILGRANAISGTLTDAAGAAAGLPPGTFSSGSTTPAPQGFTFNNAPAGPLQ